MAGWDALGEPERLKAWDEYRLTCGEHPALDENRGPTTWPMEELEPQSEYYYAAMTAERAVQGDLSEAHFGAGGYILDIDLDYLIKMEETPQDAPEERGAEARRESEAAMSRIQSWLCKISAQCFDIPNELRQGIPSKTAITEAELQERMAPIRELLARLPFKPCLVTMARSNEGGNLPLQATHAIEQSMLDAIHWAFGEEIPTQYTKAAPTQAAYQRIAFDAGLAKPPKGRVL